MKLQQPWTLRQNARTNDSISVVTEKRLKSLTISFQEKNNFLYIHTVPYCTVRYSHSQTYDLPTYDQPNLRPKFLEEYFNSNHYDRAMAQAVSRRPPTRGGPASIPAQSTWDLWWTKWHWDRFPSQYFCFPLSLSFHRCSTIIFIYTLFTTRTNVRSLGTLQANALSEIGQHWI